MESINLHSQFAGVLPATVSRESLEDARNVILAEINDVPVICVYCPQNKAFAWWIVFGNGGRGIWASYAPLDLSEMLEFCTVEGLKFPLEEEFSKWIAHLRQASGNDTQ